jgi:hypothetical protein
MFLKGDPPLLKGPEEEYPAFRLRSGGAGFFQRPREKEGQEKKAYNQGISHRVHWSNIASRRGKVKNLPCGMG